jgi:CRISPR-associated protein Csb1
MSLTYDQLRAAVDGGAVGVRAHIELEPLGGTGTKVFPPTYSVERSATTQYAVEVRKVVGADGRMVEVADRVVLDSVSSQANRIEEALLDAITSGDLAAPVTAVDFGAAGLAGLDRITDYDAPHRIFDALLRDSFDGDDLFRNGPTGRAITEASSRNAAALFHHSPHTLVLGGWDSTGPKGGRGAKFERALTSEIVAHDIHLGKKTSSRIDPAGIELKAGPLYKAKDGIEWTHDPAEAVLDKAGKPVLITGGGEGAAGRPSQVNHGNVTPSVDDKAGGVVAGRIVATTVLSLIQLRRLRFPADVDGSAIAPVQRKDVEGAARTALAALGLAGVVLAFELGFDLRSRCVLAATDPLVFDIVGRAGSVETAELDGASALALVAQAATAASATGLGWRTHELVLAPADRLVELIRRSQDIAVAGEAQS